jgi:hypothetical protein
MDGNRFDTLTKCLATAGTSRRRFLRGFGGGMTGALLALIGGVGAEADTLCKPSGHLPQSKCTKNAQCCSGRCDQGNCCTPLTCDAYAGQCGTLSDGCGGTLTCTCDAGQCLTCGSDNTCVSVCNADQVCSGGNRCCPTDRPQQCGDTCCLDTVACDPSGSGCCVGIGNVTDGGQCSQNGDCCSGLCNGYTGLCFSGCLPNGTPSFSAENCCSGYVDIFLHCADAH